MSATAGAASSDPSQGAAADSTQAAVDDSQRGMPKIDSDDDLIEQNVGGGAPSDGLQQMMKLLTQLVKSMPATMAAAINADKPVSHLDNA